MRGIRFFCAICAIFFFVPLLWIQGGAGECVVCRDLAERGFPPSYREGLCALCLMHPNWEFEALEVTALSRERGEDYTFSLVLDQEIQVPARNLVSASAAFAPYRDLTGQRHDSGLYSASREAVAYFLDPRNFLTEQGVFQFLVCSGGKSSDRESVEKILVGTCLEGKGVENVLIAIANERNLDPLPLAARLFQEQGKEGNVLFWGNAGTTLWHWYETGTQTEDGRRVLAPGSGYDREELVSLDGYFNPFNAQASGQGAFAVYCAGAGHAKKMGWDTLEKGLRGGVEKIADEYLLRYQGTPYLQKWNVDPRSLSDNGASRNFWGQYMQNIGGAKSEGDTLFRIFLESGNLDRPHRFQIPVYEGMPEIPSADPARGACAAFASQESPVSFHRYEEEEGGKKEEEGETEMEAWVPPEKKNPETVEKASLSPLFRGFLLLVFFLVSFVLLLVLTRLLHFLSPVLLRDSGEIWLKYQKKSKKN